jgi:transcription factor IIIB subunit 2
VRPLLPFLSFFVSCTDSLPLAEKQTGPDGELKPVSKRPVRLLLLLSLSLFSLTDSVSAAQRKRTKPRDGTTATGINAADATSKMLEKKKFSKKINYDAINNLFNAGSDAGSTVGGGSDDDDGEPFIGQRYGKKGRKGRMDGPIVTPEPGWRRGSRAPSEAASVVESHRGGREEVDDHVEAEPEPAADEDNAWKSQFATTPVEDEYDGYDEL